MSSSSALSPSLMGESIKFALRSPARIGVFIGDPWISMMAAMASERHRVAGVTKVLWCLLNVTQQTHLFHLPQGYCPLRSLLEYLQCALIPYWAYSCAAFNDGVAQVARSLPLLLLNQATNKETLAPTLSLLAPT